jgi:hypothetical protein
MDSKKKARIDKVLNELYEGALGDGVASAQTGMREPYLAGRKEKIARAQNDIEEIVDS